MSFELWTQVLHFTVTLVTVCLVPVSIHHTCHSLAWSMLAIDNLLFNTTFTFAVVLPMVSMASLFGWGWRSPATVAGPGEEPGHPHLDTRSKPSSIPLLDLSVADLGALLTQFPQLAAWWRDMCPAGVHDLGDSRSGHLPPGCSVGVEVPHCCTSNETTC